MNKETPVAVALGSNLGDRHAFIQLAISELAHLLRDLRISRVYETDPVDVVGHQPRFLNAAAIGTTSERDPRVLLNRLQAIEHAAGRERPFPNAARTLDLDLILFGDVILDEPDLTVPHPRFRERRFVLEPLAEIAGAWRDPVSGRSITQLLEILPPAA